MTALQVAWQLERIAVNKCNMSGSEYNRSSFFSDTYPKVQRVISKAHQLGYCDDEYASYLKSKYSKEYLSGGLRSIPADDLEEMYNDFRNLVVE